MPRLGYKDKGPSVPTHRTKERFSIRWENERKPDFALRTFDIGKPLAGSGTEGFLEG